MGKIETELSCGDPQDPDPREIGQLGSKQIQFSFTHRASTPPQLDLNSAPIWP
jgi:hypothetical protein